jgi:hypothetical protein
MGKRTEWAWLAVVMASILASVARADEPPRIAVVVAGSDAARAELESGLAGQSALPVELRLSPLPNVPAPASDPGLAARLSEARSRYIAADFEGCLARLADDAQLAEVLGRGEVTLAARTLLWRTACEAARGAAGEADRAAQQFARMGFELPPDAGAVTPDVERLLTDALAAAQRAPRVPLRVESTREVAEVSIDGRSQGCVTPCTLEVAPGEHVVALSADGLTPLVTRTTVRRGGPVLALSPELASPELARRQWSARQAARRELDDAASLRLLARAVPAQKLVLIHAEPVQGERVELRGAYAVDGQVAARAGSRPVSLHDLDEEGLSLVEELLVRGNTLEPARPVWKNPWLWVAVGLGAAAAATATALLLREPEQRTEIRIQ